MKIIKARLHFKFVGFGDGVTIANLDDARSAGDFLQKVFVFFKIREIFFWQNSRMNKREPAERLVRFSRLFGVMLTALVTERDRARVVQIFQKRAVELFFDP